MGLTRIEWTDRVWNPTTGCTKVSSGCKNCYAERDFHWPYPGRAFTDIRTHPERLEQPLHWKKSRKIFVNSMSDLFHESIPDDFIDRVFAVMALCPKHIFQILTKRPERMRAYLSSADLWVRLVLYSNRAADGGEATSYGRPSLVTIAHRTRREPHRLRLPLPNVCLGVSVEDQSTADERISVLLQTPAAVRFVSYEPALGPWDASRWLGLVTNVHGTLARYSPDIDWVICGGESGPNARPMHPAWARNLRDQCQVAGVPFFMKQIIQNGRKIPFEQWPKDLQIRKYPNANARTESKTTRDFDS